MALVVSPSTPSSSGSTSGSSMESVQVLGKELLLPGAADRPSNEDSHAKNAKKRPLDSLDATCVTSANDTAAATCSRKKTRTQKRRVRFPTELTETRTFSIDYTKDDLWWTKEETRLHMERQMNLLQFYANNCPEMVDSVLLVWVHCAEEAMADGNYCMTMQQRAEVSLAVAQSPIRGFERELAAELIGEQRIKTIGGILELQALCQQNGVTLEEKQQALAAASQAFSTTANLFATCLAKADAKVAQTYCHTGL